MPSLSSPSLSLTALAKTLSPFILIAGLAIVGVMMVQPAEAFPKGNGYSSVSGLDLGSGH